MQSSQTFARPGVTLVLPAFNEQEAIGRAINEADAALSQITGDYEIIVVDDGSSDATAEVTRDIGQSNPHVRLVRHECNIGYGAALRDGFAAASKQYVAFTDADCQFDLRELDRLVLLSNDYDIVCGYRIDRQDTPLRCFYSRCYNQLVRLLLGTKVRDVDCALKLFRRDVITEIDIKTDGFLVNSEILTQASQKGYSVVEVGVSHRPRTEGESTVSISHIPKVLKALLRYWWNSVQFPASAVAIPAERSANRRTLGYCQLGLLLLAAIFVLTNLSYPLIDRDETRYAEIPREMVVTGNWILPHLNFEPYYDKPPLLYWLCAASYNVFGISEWSARLPAALAALSTLAATMWFGSRWFGRRIGLYGGVVLALSAGFVFSSRYLLIDGVLTSFVTMSLMTAYEAIRSEKLKQSWWIASAVCCGLAFLTKGPIAIVLWLPPVFAIAWMSDAHSQTKLRHYMLFAGIVFAVAAPWFILVSFCDDRFLAEFFVTHNVRRFGGQFHAKPIWFFIPVLLVAGHPWSFLTIPMARFMFKRDHESCSQRPPALGFLAFWSGWCFLFFSVSKCKLPTYLLPASPAFALITGHYLHVILHRSNLSMCRLAQVWSPKVATITTCVVAIGMLAFVLETQSEVSVMPLWWMLVWTATLVGSVLLLRDRQNASSAWNSTAAVSGLLAIMVMHQLVPAFSRHQTLFGSGSPLSREMARTPHIATIAHEFSEVPYYLDRADIRHWSSPEAEGLADFLCEESESLLIINNDSTFQQIKKRLPEGATATVLAKRGPATFVRVSNQPKRYIARQSDAIGKIR